MAAEPRETIACSRCRKRFFADTFGVNRLGTRYKCCPGCMEYSRRKPRLHCPHGRQKNLCAPCQGSSVCAHLKNKSSCRICRLDGYLGLLCSNRINRVLGEHRQGQSTSSILGCDMAIFRAHIEAQFKPGMTWENHTSTGWHIDHIVPLGWNNPTIEQVAERLHYTNC